MRLGRTAWHMSLVRAAIVTLVFAYSRISQGACSEAKQVIWCGCQQATHLVEKREAWLDLGSLIARVAVLLDPKSASKHACAVKASRGSDLLQTRCELQTDRWR